MFSHSGIPEEQPVRSEHRILGIQYDFKRLAANTPSKVQPAKIWRKLYWGPCSYKAAHTSVTGVSSVSRLLDQKITKAQLISEVNFHLNIAALKRRGKPEISSRRGLEMSLLATGKWIVSLSPCTLAPRVARIEWRKRWDKSSCYWM